MSNVIRITTRMGNVYKYDVEVECQKLAGILTNNSMAVVDLDRIAIDQKNGVFCHLKGGFSVELFMLVVKYLGFRIQLMSNVSEYAFERGNQTKGQTEVDLYMASYALKASRAAVVDPSYIIGQSTLKAFLNHDFEDIGRDLLFASVDISVWVFILGTAFACSATFQILNFIKTGQHNFQVDLHLFYDSLSIILQKGSQRLQRSADSLRTAATVTSLCFFILVVAYSGWIVAISSVNKNSINSLEELVKSKYYILLDRGYGNKSSTEVILQKLRGEDTHVDVLLRKAAVCPVKFDTFRKAIESVRDVPVAFVTDDDSGRIAIRASIGKVPCSWSRLDVRGIRYPWSMYMRKGFHYRKEINALLLKMDERGVMQLLRKRSIPDIPQTLCFKSPVQLPLRDIASGFYPLILGNSLALVLLIAELFSAARLARQGACRMTCF